MTKQLSRVAAAVFDRPWYAIPEHLQTIAELVTFHLQGGTLSQEEIDERLETAAAGAGPRGGGRTQGAIGVIPIYGTIFPRANLMTSFSGGATVEGLRDAFRQAMADESVGSILFDVDSPGGSTDGIDELASEIRAARGQKPITAIANYCMASAAYYLSSQADEIVASPSSQVGWIGTFMVHQEASKANELAGITTTIIRNPPGKAGVNPYEPLSDDARAAVQAIVDERTSQFHDAVAKGRVVSAATVRKDFGQGNGMTASAAKAAGLVDRIESFDQTIKRLAIGRGPAPRGVGADLDVVAAAADRSIEAQAALALARAQAEA